MTKKKRKKKEAKAANEANRTDETNGSAARRDWFRLVLLGSGFDHGCPSAAATTIFESEEAGQTKTNKQSVRR